MKFKLNYLSLVTLSLIAAGCTTTQNPTDISQFSELKEVHSINKSLETANSSADFQQISDEKDEKLNVYKKKAPKKPTLDELTSAIHSDFEKKRMLINMQCQEVNEKLSSQIIVMKDEPTLGTEVKMTSSKIINDLREKLKTIKDPNIVAAYEQEITRLGLEVKVDQLQQLQDKLEQQKEESLDLIDDFSEKSYKCAITLAQNKAEMAKALLTAQMSSSVSLMYKKRIETITHELNKTKKTLEEINSDTVDEIEF